MAIHEESPESSLERLRESAQKIEREQILYPLVFSVVGIIAWTGIVELFDLPLYILPTPFQILDGFAAEMSFFAPHAQATIFEAFFGWVVGNIIGVTLGLVMAESRGLRISFYPYLIALRSIPVIAFAPLLILWMGLNVWPILATATITTFFPTLVNSIAGFNSTDQLTEELMHSLDASRWQVFRHVKIYNAMPYIFSSLKITVALSMIGAVVGEWLAADQGLGYLIVVANNQIDTILLFRSIILIGLFGTAWFALLTVTERLFLDWKQTGDAGATR
ncbi:ABC transporter permease [Haloarcula sp. GH36]|uniref:ABC transporter permease n=1 Tax=Haloarcula montana TaxID=3111776 RepID=UPI002D779E10|nr:ABC transporter permease [Haloarcula sp. GH36]